MKLNTNTTIGAVGVLAGIQANDLKIQTTSNVNQAQPVDVNKLITVGAGTFNLTHPDNVIGEINGSFNNLNYSSTKVVNPLNIKNVSGNNLVVNILDDITDQGSNVLLGTYQLNTTKDIVQVGGVSSASTLSWTGKTIDQTGGALQASNATFTVTGNGDVAIQAPSSNVVLGASQASGDVLLVANSVTQGGVLKVAGKVEIQGVTAVSAPNVISSDAKFTTPSSLKWVKVGAINLPGFGGTGLYLESLASGTSFAGGASGTPAIALNSGGNQFGNLAFSTPLGSSTTVTGVSQITIGATNATNVTLKANTINAANINSVGGSIAVQGGSVNLGNISNASTINIQGNSINAGQMTATGLVKVNATGGDIDISGFIQGGTINLSGNQVRVHGIDINGNSLDASAITITHQGNGIIPFVVGGGSAVNGTAGNIANGGIPLGSYLYFFGAGNYQLVTGGTPPIPVLGGGISGNGNLVLEQQNFENLPSLLLRAFEPLSVDGLLTASEVIAGVDGNFMMSYGMAGFEPENGIASIGQIQEVLEQAAGQGRGRAALLYWWWRDAQLTLGVVLPRNLGGNQSIFVKTVGVDQSEVEKAINDFVFMIKDPRQRNTQNYRPSAQKLYSWLVSPIEGILQENGIETIILVPDEKFRTIPYRALWNGQEYFIERYRLVQIPSINLANFDLTSSSLVENVVAMGAEHFNGRESPLPAVPLELKQVAEVNRGAMRLNEAFKFGDFLQIWRQNLRGGIHLATHADFTSARSYIQFWDRAVGFQELRGQLNTTRSELVVLSACRTSIGDSYAELGFSGLALQLGAKRAIASLWYVEDEATLALMNEFYRWLQADSVAPIKVEALRQAQIGMIRGNTRIEGKQLVGDGYQISLPPALRQDNRNFIHPYYWAGFNMIGNPF